MHPPQDVRSYFSSSKSLDVPLGVPLGTMKLIVPEPPTVPSSLPYSTPTSSASSSPSGSQTRGRKRDRHSSIDEMMEMDGEANGGEEFALPPNGIGLGVGSMAIGHTNRLTQSKLSAKTLLYQLHVLRSDEKLLLSGVGGSGAIDCQVHTEIELEERGSEQSAAPARTYDPSVMTDDDFLPTATKLADETPAVEDEPLEPLSLAQPISAHPLFPESMDYVRFFLTPAQAHTAFVNLQQSWARKGVRGVKERILELQLTAPVKMLVIASEAQRKQWLSSNDSPSTMDTSDAQPSPAPVQRADKPTSHQTTLFGTLAASNSSSSSSSAPIWDSPNPSSFSPSNSLPSLYTAPDLSKSLRSLLESSEDSLDGFVVTSVRMDEQSADGMDLTDSSVLDGEVILRGSVCATRLHVLDDDKKNGRNQQLLTDLFGRVAVSSSSSSSSRVPAHGSMMHSYDQATSMMTDDEIMLSSLAPASSSSSFTSFHSLPTTSNSFSAHAPVYKQSILQLQPSSFSPALQAASQAMFANGFMNGASSSSSSSIPPRR